MTSPHPPHPLTPYPPLIVNAALTGMVGRRAEIPRLPVTREQIVRDAWVCHSLGASVLHVHLRDADEAPDWDPQAYGDLIAAVRERCPDAVICASTPAQGEGNAQHSPSDLVLRVLRVFAVETNP